MTASASATAPFDALAAKVDAFFARVSERYQPELACRAGCDDCCRRRLTVTGVEAARITEGLGTLDPAAREELTRRARSSDTSSCAALAPDGRCGIYAFRPLVCRSHGLPIRFAPDVDTARRSLPVLDTCFKNFVGRDLATVDADCVLDQTTLSTVLAAIDAAHADATGRPRGERVDLAELLAFHLPRPGS